MNNNDNKTREKQYVYSCTLCARAANYTLSYYHGIHPHKQSKIVKEKLHALVVLQPIRSNGIAKTKHSANNTSVSKSPVVIADSAPRSIVADLNCSLYCPRLSSIDHQSYRILKRCIGSCKYVRHAGKQ